MPDLFNYFKIRLIDKFSVNEARFNEDFNKWVDKYGSAIQRKNDFIYSTYNKLVFEASMGNSGVALYRVLRPLYVDMWSFLIKEGKQASHLLKLFLYCDLYLAQDDTYKMRAMLITGKCCPECDKVDGIVISLEQALETQPIPIEGCTRSLGCICSYGFGVVRDLDGMPVRK